MIVVDDVVRVDPGMDAFAGVVVWLSAPVGSWGLVTAPKQTSANMPTKGKVVITLQQREFEGPQAAPVQTTWQVLQFLLLPSS